MTNQNWQGVNIGGGETNINNPIINFGSPEQNSPPNIPNNLIYKSVVKFVGRDDELTKIHHQLQQSDKVAISAVAGMGGVGKTQLVTEYARKHEADYPGGICWLNARATDLAASIVQFYRLYIGKEIPKEFGGKLLNLQEQVQWCWQHWQPFEGLVLVVLDDVTNLESLGEIQPTANRFRVLITTRLRNLNPNFVQEISLDVLPEIKALELLTAFVGEKRIQQEEITAKDLCKWLGYLPLGLELVGQYLAEDPDLSLAEMLERLKAQHLDDEALERRHSTLSAAQLGVKAAFELSWRELDEKTQLVGALLSLFAPDVIPWQLVESTSELLNWAKADVTEARKQLYKRNLIQILKEKNACYQIHPLIREFFQGKFRQVPLIAGGEELGVEFKQAFAVAMVAKAKEIPETLTRKVIESVEDTIPHIQEVAQNLIDVVKDEDLILVFVGLGKFYEGQGLYRLAEPWRMQCLSTVKTRLGEEHLHVAQSLNNLASLYYFQGNYTAAEPLYQQALAMRKRLLGDEHPDVARNLNNLAELYRSQGNYTAAEPLYQQALAMRKRLLGDEHPDVARNLNNLAELYRSQGNYTAAEPLYQQALAMRKRLLGDEHPDVAGNLNNLALLYFSQGNYTAAEPLYKQALAMYKRLLGDEHPNVASSLNNLALLYFSQGNYTAAEPLYQQALAMYKRLLGDEHPDVAQSLNNLAELYRSQGNYTAAEPLYQQALAMRKRLLGDEHPDVAGNLNNLALLYFSQGNYTAAEPLLQQALAMRKRLLGDEHPDVARNLNNLAELYRSQGNYTAAEPLYQQALAMYKRLLGDEHPDVAQSLNNLASLYYFQGNYTAAEPLYQQALAMRKRLLGDEHPDVAGNLNNLALLYFSQGNYTAAEPLLQQALAIFEQKLGVNHPNTVECRKNLKYLHLVPLVRRVFKIGAIAILAIIVFMIIRGWA
ncbi:tetratricopeptide repeat protein [uncultured Nostoc sp.]|uniref:tetratricopeptide repeat protein n=1 Tax=uncultured Nostoc sp. TaxID=340711 RepID=UPI0035C98F3E